MKTKISNINANDHLKTKFFFQPYERIAQTAYMSKDLKRNWYPCKYPDEYERFYKMATLVPLGLIRAFEIHCSSICRCVEVELAGDLQLRSLQGVNVLSHPTIVIGPVGIPEAPRHLITDSRSSFFNLNLLWAVALINVNYKYISRMA